MEKYFDKLSSEEAEIIMRYLGKTAKVNDRVQRLPPYLGASESVQYSIADATLVFNSNPTSRRESTRVLCSLLALDKKSLNEAKFILRNIGPSDEPMTDERHDW